VVVGRQVELAFLDESMARSELNVISLVGRGGVGKSTLIKKWLERLKADDFRRFNKVYAWSFYVQGTNPFTVSSDEFVLQALQWFGASTNDVESPWNRGERLAELIRREKLLIILDGLEPLQNCYLGIRDPALRIIIEEFARQNAGLCLITTRQPIQELLDFTQNAMELHLDKITNDAGRSLLKIKGVRGTDA
jgi:hypothetical protein